jgi:hypothetical protein
LSAVLTKDPDWRCVPTQIQPLLRSCLAGCGKWRVLS